MTKRKSEFQRGDIVKLTGESWGDSDMLGKEVVVKGWDDEGDAVFDDPDSGIGDWAIYTSDGEDYSATLVPRPRPQPGDLVRNVVNTGLDYRIVVRTGVDPLGLGEWLTLDFGRGVESDPLPSSLFAVVPPTDSL